MAGGLQPRVPGCLVMQGTVWPCQVIILLIPAQQHRSSSGPCLAAPCCASLTDTLLWHTCGTTDPTSLALWGRDREKKMLPVTAQ